MNIKDVTVVNTRLKNDILIKEIIKFLNNDKHLEMEEIFTVTELNNKFTNFVDPFSLLKIMKKRNIPEDNFVAFHPNTNNVKYIFGHPKLIKILKENL